MISKTPQPPYYAVIFTSILSNNMDGYNDMSDLMVSLAHQQDGFLGLESVREELGITVSYWRDLEAIKQWKMHSKHLIAQKNGKTLWYDHYKTRIAKVERDYESHL